MTAFDGSSTSNALFASHDGAKPRSLVTGGAGFVGSNVADRLAALGHEVIVLDNLSRPGVERNWTWLKSRHPHAVRCVRGSVLDEQLVRSLLPGCSYVLHFAAQVAVTTSLRDPALDFATNLRGTFNVLEAMRAQVHPPALLFTSTNKVYGDLADVELRETDNRYAPAASRIGKYGISERRTLDFHSPYGCSKGAADQYVLDYGRSFGLDATVFRMSCIYGRRQFGTEDQGWVAHFMLSAMRDLPITIYGNGKQVRDILYIDDLVAAVERFVSKPRLFSGHAFNIGGGADNAISLLALIAEIRRLTRKQPQYHFEPWRTGDQPFYISDVRKMAAITGWRPRIPVKQGLARLHSWLQQLVTRNDNAPRFRTQEQRPVA